MAQDNENTPLNRLIDDELDKLNLTSEQVNGPYGCLDQMAYTGVLGLLKRKKSKVTFNADATEVNLHLEVYLDRADYENIAWKQLSAFRKNLSSGISEVEKADKTTFDFPVESESLDVRLKGYFVDK